MSGWPPTANDGVPDPPRHSSAQTIRSPRTSAKADGSKVGDIDLRVSDLRRLDRAVSAGLLRRGAGRCRSGRTRRPMSPASGRIPGPAWGSPRQPGPLRSRRRSRRPPPGPTKARAGRRPPGPAKVVVKGVHRIGMGRFEAPRPKDLAQDVAVADKDARFRMKPQVKRASVGFERTSRPLLCGW